MKRSFALAASTLLLTGCGESKTMEKTTTPTTNKSEKKMTRTKTASGLEYEILTEGTGESPRKGQQVTVHYTGWLNKDGKPGDKFDSSVDRGQKFTFVIGVGQVIKGWDEGVASMKVGEKRRLFLPSTLGYGATGAGRSIPPHADLIFDVELFRIS